MKTIQRLATISIFALSCRGIASANKIETNDEIVVPPHEEQTTDEAEKSDTIDTCKSVDDAFCSAPDVESNANENERNDEIEFPPELKSILIALEEEKRVVHDLNLESSMEKYKDLESLYNSHIKAMEDDNDYMLKQMRYLDHLKMTKMQQDKKWNELVERTNKLSKRIHTYNVRQMHDLLLRLQKNIIRELQYRKEEELRKSKIEKEPNIDDYVTYDEVENTLKAILADSPPWEQELEGHVRKIVDEIFYNNYTLLQHQYERELSNYENETKHFDPKSTCTTKSQMKSMIHESIQPSFLRDLIDFIPQAHIVHAKSYTSKTYTSDMASYVESLFGHSHTLVQNDNTNLHSCWPMAMSSSSSEKGSITFYFPKPVYLKSVAIHHVSPLLLTTEQRRLGTGSAPRFFHVQAYAPCDPNVMLGDQGCELGFKEDDYWDLVSGEYRWGEGVVQHFPLGGKTAAVPASEDVAESDEEENFVSEKYMDSGSCSMPPASVLDDEYDTPSCDDNNDDSNSYFGEDYSRAVQAISLIIDENSGHDKYTCLYRFQAFGTTVENI